MTAPARPPRLRRWLLSLVLLLVLLHTGAWWFATSRLQSAFAAWQQRLRAAGYAVTATPGARSGWPLAAGLAVRQLTIAAPSGWSWQASDVRLQLRLKAPTELRVAFAGAQRFGLTGLAPLSLTAKSLVLQAPLTPAFPTAPLTLRGQALRLAAAGSVATIGSLTGHLRADPAAGPQQTAAALDVTAEEIALPGAPAAKVLGPAISRFGLHLALSGPLAFAASGEEAAQAWHAQGGALTLTQATLLWGPVRLAASGRFALDSGLQPKGEATVRVQGIDALLHSAVVAGSLTAAEARAGRAVLMLLAQPTAEQGAPALAVPVTLHDQVLAAGPFLLLRLPKFSWRAATAAAIVPP